MPPVAIRLDKGWVTSRDRSELTLGELQQATGGFYRPGDTERIHKIGGRSTFGDTGAASRIKGIGLALFDSGGQDKLVALAGTTLYGATPGVTGTFSPIATGVSASAGTMLITHFENRWYVTVGAERNRVIESDGTVRFMGMIGPQSAPVGTPSTGGTLARPTTDDGGFVNSANARDTDGSTFARGSRNTPGVVTGTWFGWSASTAASRRVWVKWQVGGLQSDTGGNDFGVGGQTQGGFEVTVELQVSQDNGATFSTFYSENTTTATPAPVFSQSPVLTADSANVRFRAKMTYVEGAGMASLKIFDVSIRTGGTGANFSTTTGLFYAVTEFDGVRKLESPYSPASTKVTLSNQNTVTLTLPTPAQNSNATHWRVYRTPDGGVVPDQLGLIGTVPISESTFQDVFAIDKDTQARPVVALVTVTANDGGSISVPRDSPPPAFVQLNAYKGSLVGVRSDEPRALHYSEAGRPESWPEIYVVRSFPLPENDQLVATVTIGDTLLVAAKGAMLVLSDLPRVAFGTFNAAEASPLRGAPGCVGPYAITLFSVTGESRAAWVSRFGIYETNGATVRRLTDEIFWDQEVTGTSLEKSVLYWDKKRQVLVFAYDGTGSGDNDRFLLLHMAPEHQKPNGLPKHTGPHYGKISSLVAGEISGVYRLYSGHTSDGKVYHEDRGTTDESQSFSGTVVPMIIKTGRMYGDSRDLAAYRARVYHTDFGASETLSLSASAGRDSTGETQTATKTISANGQNFTDAFIGLGGEWLELTIQHTGAAQGAIGKIELDLLQMGRSGRAKLG